MVIGKIQLAWHRGKQYLLAKGYLNRVVFDDVSRIEIHQHDQVYVRRKAGEDYLPTCTASLARNRVVVIIWSYMTFNGVGTISFVDSGNINAKKYKEVLNIGVHP